MRLFKRQSNGVWYVSLARGKEKSLKTKDKSIAETIFRRLKKEILLGKVISLEKQENPKFSQFRKEYEKLRLRLLADKQTQPRDYPASVLTTWKTSFEAVRQRIRRGGGCPDRQCLPGP